MPQNVASDQGLHCLLTEHSIKNLKSEKYHHKTLKTGMDLSNLQESKIPVGINGLKRQSQQMSSAFVVCLNVEEASCSNSED